MLLITIEIIDLGQVHKNFKLRTEIHGYIKLHVKFGIITNYFISYPNVLDANMSMVPSIFGHY